MTETTTGDDLFAQCANLNCRRMRRCLRAAEDLGLDWPRPGEPADCTARKLARLHGLLKARMAKLEGGGEDAAARAMSEGRCRVCGSPQ